MTVQQVKDWVGEYLRQQYLGGAVSLEEAQRCALLLEDLPDSLPDDQLQNRVRTLDDQKKIMSPIVFKLLGDWDTN